MIELATVGHEFEEPRRSLSLGPGDTKETQLRPFHLNGYPGVGPSLGSSHSSGAGAGTQVKAVKVRNRWSPWPNPGPSLGVAPRRAVLLDSAESGHQQSDPRVAATFPEEHAYDERKRLDSCISNSSAIPPYDAYTLTEGTIMHLTREADIVSSRWQGRFVRGSAAVGEEAITSDILLALEEKFAPYVREVRSFSRTEEGGSRAAPALGADFEVHFVTSDFARHIGYRVQAKMAKRSRLRSPVYDYDFNYEIRHNEKQIDALIAAAGSCVPLYLLYNRPEAIDELLDTTISSSHFFRRWVVRRGCYPIHHLNLEAALTISALPAILARHEARHSRTQLVRAVSVARYLTPWSCLFHQEGGLANPRRGADGPGSQLRMIDVTTSLADYLDGLANLVERRKRLPRVDSSATVSQLRLQANRASEPLPAPTSVAALWQGSLDFDPEYWAESRADSFEDRNSELRNFEIRRTQSVTIIQLES